MATVLPSAPRAIGHIGPKAPLCRGHQEPCVRKRVNKSGPNKGVLLAAAKGNKVLHCWGSVYSRHKGATAGTGGVTAGTIGLQQAHRGYRGVTAGTEGHLQQEHVLLQGNTMQHPSPRPPSPAPIRKVLQVGGRALLVKGCSLTIKKWRLTSKRCC